MARVMIIGYGPLPRAGMKMLGAPAIRTRQLLLPILAAGHTVNLFTLPLPGTEGQEGEVPSMLPDNHEGFGFQRFSTHDGEFIARMLREQARQLEPATLLGVGTLPAYIAATLGTPIPLWADFPGAWMAENQGSAWINQDDSGLEEAWAVERTILRRLDKFSAVSRAQLHALIGELGAVGRLNRYTFDYPFGHHIPNSAFRWSSLAPVEPPDGDAKGPILRGPLVPSDSFLILWSGGIKPSFDVPMLISVMNKLMERYPSVHFVATGGRIDRAADRAYQLFEELIEQSPYKDRFHLLGWIDAHRLAAVYREADLGIHMDGPNYETMFGGRNRINAMAAEGLPIAITTGTEISEWLDDGHAVMSAGMGDADAMVEAIEPWIDQREALKMYAGRARQIVDRDFNADIIARKLLAWLRNPKPAPDNKAKLQQAQGQPIDPLSVAINSLEEQAMLISRHDARDLAVAAAKLDADRARKGFRFTFRRP